MNGLQSEHRAHEKPDIAPDKLRVMTLNVHKGLTFFNRKYMLPELRDAINAMEVDMVFLQEVIGAHEGHAKRLVDWLPTPQYEYLADTLWPQFAYGRNAVYPQGDHGNALLCKFPILQHQNLDVTLSGSEERGLLHCVVDIPGRAEVHTVCVHLGLRETHRYRQLQLLSDLLNSLPPEAPAIVAGDFNDWRGRAGPVLEACGMQEAFAAAFGAPARTFPARWPVLRLDRVYVRNALTFSPQVHARKPWSHLSDHAPLVAGIQL